jgi:hypothetical protein
MRIVKAGRFVQLVASIADGRGAAGSVQPLQIRAAMPNISTVCRAIRRKPGEPAH